MLWAHRPPILFRILVIISLFIQHVNSITSSSPPKPAIEWMAANETNYQISDRINRHEIKYIFIHDTQETLSRTIYLFKKYRNVAAHYVINNHLSPWEEDRHARPDGHIIQMVHDKDIGYHVKGANTYSIGIEHVAMINPVTLTVKGGFSYPCYWNSAKLTAHLCGAYQIPISRDYILAHGENKKIGGTSDHVDPGVDWDWNLYIHLVRAAYSGDCCYPKFHLNDEGRSVRVLQMLLKQYFPRQVLSGRMDNLTLNNIESFKKNRIHSNSLVDDRYLWEGLLNIENPNQTLGWGDIQRSATLSHIIRYLLEERYYMQIISNSTDIEVMLQTFINLFRDYGIIKYSTNLNDLKLSEFWSVLIAGCSLQCHFEKESKQFNSKSIKSSILIILMSALSLLICTVILVKMMIKPRLKHK